MLRRLKVRQDTANLEAERLWDCIMASCPEGALVPFSPMSDWGSEKANESPLVSQFCWNATGPC